MYFDTNGLVHCMCAATRPGNNVTVNGTTYKECYYNCSCDCNGKKVSHGFFVTHYEGSTCIGQQGYYQMSPFSIDSSKLSIDYWLNPRIPDEALDKIDELCPECE